MPGRDMGHTGRAAFNGGQFAVDDWVLIAGEIASRERRQGWFHCRDDRFRARRSERMRLSLDPLSGPPFEVDVEITAALPEKHLWQFKTVS